MFVEDKFVAFGMRCYFKLFSGWISVEKVGVDNAMLRRSSRGCVISSRTFCSMTSLLSCRASWTLRENPLTFNRLCLVGFVAEILGSSGGEFSDRVSVIDFVGCPSEIVTMSFSSPEATLLLVSTKNHDLWLCPISGLRFTIFRLLCAHLRV